MPGRRGCRNEKSPSAQATPSNATASAHFSTWPPKTQPRVRCESMPAAACSCSAARDN